jgi:hypothetical protein
MTAWHVRRSKLHLFALEPLVFLQSFKVHLVLPPFSAKLILHYPADNGGHVVTELFSIDVRPQCSTVVWRIILLVSC